MTPGIDPGNSAHMIRQFEQLPKVPRSLIYRMPDTSQADGLRMTLHLAYKSDLHWRLTSSNKLKYCCIRIGQSHSLMDACMLPASRDRLALA